MTTPSTTDVLPGEPRSRLSPADVRGVRFTRSGLGWRGYDEREVDAFLLRVETQIGQMIAEKGELRDEVIRLRSQLKDCAQDAGTVGPRSDEAEAQAVRILARAQQTADQYVAEAEQYSRRIALDARQHYEEVVAEARARSAEVLTGAHHIAMATGGNGGLSGNGTRPIDSDLDKEDLEQQVTYLQTFSQVCRVQLRSYLEALLREVEEQWGRADPGVVLNGRREVATAMLPAPAGATSMEPREPVGGSQ
jgi:DivIVA domain-containing protein